MYAVRTMNPIVVICQYFAIFLYNCLLDNSSSVFVADQSLHEETEIPG